tara:strand:- start:1 stop:216 length:216 start_codon:yes stop_codon:yes gene_type:complete
MKYALVFWSVTVLCIYYAMTESGWLYIFCWLGLSFGVAGAAYVGARPRVFGKRQDSSLISYTLGKYGIFGG